MIGNFYFAVLHSGDIHPRSGPGRLSVRDVHPPRVAGLQCLLAPRHCRLIAISDRGSAAFRYFHSSHARHSVTRYMER